MFTWKFHILNLWSSWETYTNICLRKLMGVPWQRRRETADMEGAPAQLKSRLASINRSCQFRGELKSISCSWNCSLFPFYSRNYQYALSEIRDCLFLGLSDCLNTCKRDCSHLVTRFLLLESGCFNNAKRERRLREIASRKTEDYGKKKKTPLLTAFTIEPITRSNSSIICLHLLIYVRFFISFSMEVPRR